jgi:imidazolonepropionase-like amidohydrolase
MPMKNAAIATLFVVTLTGGALQPQPDSSTHALVGARIVGIAGAPAIDNATILIRDGRIQAIGAAVQVPRGTRTTSLAGKFVLPGLISAHAHVSDVDGLKPRAYTAANTLRQLGLYARYGVTTEPGGRTGARVRRAQLAVRAGARPGPDLSVGRRHHRQDAG